MDSRAQWYHIRWPLPSSSTRYQWPLFQAESDEEAKERFKTFINAQTEPIDGTDPEIRAIRKKKREMELVKEGQGVIAKVGDVLPMLMP